MSGTQQPEALRLADKYEIEGFLQDHRFAKDHWCRQAAAELRRQHARIEELEAQLSAIGAGGVEPLRKPSSVAAHDDERKAFEKWARWACYDIARVSRNTQYESNITEQLWQCWQARATQAAKQGEAQQ